MGTAVDMAGDDLTVNSILTASTPGTAGTTLVSSSAVNAGASGTAGTVSVFPSTASKGKVVISATNNTGNTSTTITNAAMGQASTITIPDPGASTSNFVLSPNTEVNYQPPTSIVVKLAGVNFNSATTDNAVTVSLPSGFTRYQLSDLRISNASHTLVTATIGVFTATGGGGTTLLADSAITVSGTTAGAANSAQVLNGVSTVWVNSATLQVRIGTAEGAAATADVTLALRLFP